MNLVTRAREPRDDGFIFGHWLDSFRESHMHGPLPPDLYFSATRVAIERLLQREGFRCLLLEDQDTDPLVLAGFIAYEPAWRRWSRRKRQFEEFFVIHYLYVRASCRGEGLARRLLADAGARGRLAFSFATAASRPVLGEGALLMPDAARYPSASSASARGK